MTEIKHERLKAIQKILRETEKPVSGSDLAKHFAVSRQVIVQDIGLLRAQEAPIISTNRGYVWNGDRQATRIFKVKHSDEEIRRELTVIVDQGAAIEDVFVEHRCYGVIRAAMGIRSRKDVEDFLDNIKTSVSSPLKHITDDYHFHTVSAPNERTLDLVEEALKREGMLVRE